ncbi:hypothetical protein BDV96DRAFT_647499 [Lophiotrema nucula]|uniref:Uncharacterized protein n=1 Tax=Lophiotrema nucula TaxID=690887 RepID=A0A6A5Z3M2_9PLEO|nr:hypothetical protein BDV96DRAFT_647499 [Lophiotrema nucula]
MHYTTDPRFNFNSSKIAESTSLSITLHIESKPTKKSRAYRAVQRPDGVIVEYPRFRPQGTPKPHFEPRPLRLDNPLPMRKAEFARIVRMEEDLRAIGAFDDGLRKLGGRDGYNTPIDAGRDGYNEPAKTSCRMRNDLTPMQHFLSEPGPWTSYSAPSLTNV